VEINRRRARIVAKTNGIQNFMTTPVVFTTLDSARRFTNIRADDCSYVLITAEEGVDPKSLAASIERAVPDAGVFTAAEFQSVSERYWMKRTGIGLSFGIATLLGLVVGLLMVMQSLYALSLDHLTEYATLKAIGAEDRAIGGVIIAQAMSVAACGSIVGVSLVLAIQHVVSSPIAPIEIPPALLCGGVLIVFVICLAATILPAFRIRRVDPAVVLQG
jgi:putative ABC transport system permease protein